MTKEPDRTNPTPEAAIRSFLDRLDPAVQKLARSVRTALRKRFPTAHELGYDYPDQVVIAYGPTDRGIDAIVSVAARADGVRLYFNQGPRLPDPTGLLRGKGRQTRYLELETARRLAEPEVESLIRAAIEMAAVPLPAEGRGRSVIRGAAATPRSRRKPTS